MAARKSKRRDRSAARKPEVAPSPPAGKRQSTRRQRGLLLVALVLLAAAVWLNVRRRQPPTLPPPVPLPAERIAAQPLAGRAVKPSGATLFTALSPAETGIDFVNAVEPDHPLSCVYFSGMAAGGVAIGDVDGDDKPDIYVVGGPGKNKLYRQLDRPLQFADVTAAAGVDGGDAWGCGATMADVNGDGRLDIYVANYDSPNQLYINLGDGRFLEQAAAYGLNITDASLEGVFADYDRDGDLDLYLLTYRFENPAGMPARPPIVVRDGRRMIDPDLARYYNLTNDAIGFGTVGRSDGLLRNNYPAASFTDVTLRAGIEGQSHGQAAMWWDYDQDGYPDLYVGNDFYDPDCLYHNNGDGTFTDVVRQQVPHTTWFSMGCDAGDVDNDGRLDLLTSDMSSTTHFKQKTTMGSMGSNREFLENAEPRQYMRNALLLNSGADRFQEAAYLTGLDSTDWTWSVLLMDLDCDGWQDVFVTNGSVRSFTDSDRTLTLSQRVGRTEWDIYKDTPPLQEQNLALRNDGDLRFTDVSAAWGLDHTGVSMAAAHADLDRDGDLDLVVVNVDEPLSIYRNDASENRRVTVRLHGRGANRFGVGSRVTLQSAGGRQVRELHPSRGFLGSNEPIVQFGLGADQQVDELTIHWPSGRVQSFTDLEADRRYEITEPADDADSVPDIASPSTAKRPPLFLARPTRDAPRHQENEFDDYALQPLLPYQLSQLGPALAMADVDRDGDDDLFLGGAAGQAGTVAMCNAEGDYESTAQPALVADRDAEDLGAVWLDVDGDADVDLLVVGGGNEAAADAPLYGPRLYLNDGAGRLTRAANDVLPAIRTSGGPVAAADFDRDGDTDVFVGGRQIPGAYPLPGRSLLLRNQGGRFEDVADALAGGLAQTGMVTGALWTDVDRDGWLDLMLAVEWGSLRLFHNDQGKLVDVSAQAGLTAYQGWWTGITAVDVDGDGDQDYIATNLGLNTKYHASDEHPFRLFYGDFDGSGTKQLVEAEYEDETLFPVRGKSCSTHAMPFLAEKFTTYKDFAAATLQDIYTPQCLRESYECTANRLDGVVLQNDGQGRFQFRSLPRAAQLSPGFGVVTGELTGDGVPDVFIAQNFFAPQHETGRMDGGLGALLQGQGDGTFRAIAPADAGIVLPEDAAAASAADLNRDGRPDLIVACNDGPLRVFASNPASTGDFLAVRLAGVASAAEAAGAVIRVQAGDGRTQTAEVSAGSGYLSQQAPVYFFGRGGDVQGPWRVSVTWPGGGTSESETNGPTLTAPRPQ